MAESKIFSRSLLERNPHHLVTATCFAFQNYCSTSFLLYTLVSSVGLEFPNWMIINSLAVNLIIVDICILRFAFLGYKIMLFGGLFFFLFIYFISFSCFTINSFVVSKCAFIFLNNNEVLRADRQTLKKKNPFSKILSFHYAACAFLYHLSVEMLLSLCTSYAR